jgi:hypothetical protein
MNTGITLPLEKMTVAEKLQVIELIWEDLSKDPANIPSPEWHGNAIRRTEEALATGKDRFIDWEEAKKLLKERT